MRKTTILLIVMALAVTTFAQKGNVKIVKHNVKQHLNHTPSATRGEWSATDTLIPASFGTGTPALLELMEGMSDYGYLAGANAFGDAGKAQQYNVENESYVKKVMIWVGDNSITEGDLTFKVWDFKGDTLSTELATKAVPFAQVSATTGADFFYTVEFDEPVAVKGDFVVGVEFAGITSGFGLVSTTPGDAGATKLAWEFNELFGGWNTIFDNWMDGVTGDIDLGIFPIMGEMIAFTETDFLSFSVDGQVGETTIGEGTIELTVGGGANLAALTTYFTVSEGASVKIEELAQVSGTTVDFSAGSVTYTVTAEDGVTTQDWVVTVNGTGVNDNKAIEASIYPNPANDVLNIVTVQGASVTLMNTLGVVVDHIVLNGTSTQISTAELTTGTYLVLIENNGNRTVKKISVVR